MFQVTSEGKPKVIARYDCSGAGDVDTSTVVTMEGNVIKGLTGRSLVVNFIHLQLFLPCHILMVWLFHRYQKNGPILPASFILV